MSVFQRVHIPSLGGTTGWLNSEPLGPAQLRAGLLVAVALVGAVVCLVTGEIA